MHPNFRVDHKMDQLKFPTDYVMPPGISGLEPLPASLDHVYILTVQSIHPERHQRAILMAGNNEKITVWSGVTPSTLSEQDKDFVLADHPSHKTRNFTMDLSRLVYFNCVAKSHVNIWQDAYEKKYNKILILEDDAILSQDFLARLKVDVELSADITYLGDGCWLHANPAVDRQLSPGVFDKKNKASRCCDSYLLNRYTIELLAEYFHPVGTKMVITVDHFLTFSARLYNLNVVWVEPTYVTQGSERHIKF